MMSQKEASRNKSKLFKMMGASWVLVIWSVAIVIAVVKRSSQNAPLLENYHSCDFSKKHPWVLPSETSLPGHSVCNFNIKEKKKKCQTCFYITFCLRALFIDKKWVISCSIQRRSFKSGGWQVVHNVVGIICPPS